MPPVDAFGALLPYVAMAIILLLRYPKRMDTYVIAPHAVGPPRNLREVSNALKGAVALRFLCAGSRRM